VRWQLPKDFALYTGLYADYGFNLNTNSILFSGYHQKNLSGLFEEKLVPLSVGLKVRFAFGRGEKKKRKNRVSIIEPDSATLPDDVTEEKQVLIGESPKEPVVNTNQEEEPRKEEVKRKPDDNDDEYHAVKEKIQLPVSGYSPSETRLSKAKKKDLDDKVNLFLDLQKKRPELQIVCEGHTDDTGSDDLNIRIGMQRAEAVRTYLIEKGVSAEQITIVSKGKTEPVSTNGSGDDRKKNRRVKLLIQ
jgi:outer membrane protein OmpA-like peptidoglycan-associated protein